MSENIDDKFLNIELSNEQIIELLQFIDRSQTGSKWELKQLTRYSSLELEEIINNYPVIQRAIQIKYEEIAEQLEYQAFNSIMNKQRLGQGDSVFWKTMIESRGKRLGYGSESKKKTDDSVNDSFDSMSTDDLEKELNKLDNLDNEVIDDSTPFESYLNMIDEDDTED